MFNRLYYFFLIISDLIIYLTVYTSIIKNNKQPMFLLYKISFIQIILSILWFITIL
jgi:hypothetical protein